MFLSGSQIETISTGATWTRRQRSLFPYHPAPMRPTRLGLPLTRSAASRPQSGRAAMAATAAVLLRKARRFMLKEESNVTGETSEFMGGSMHFRFLVATRKKCGTRNADLFFYNK